MLQRFLIFSLLTISACGLASGQITTSLRGTVRDASGAVIAETAVTLSDPSTGTVRKSLTNNNGEYLFAQVTPAKYSVLAEKPGFSTSKTEDVVLEVSTPATLDIRLEVGSTGTVVSVEADSASINTVDASVGNPFTQTQVRQLPLQTRNVVELLSIQPGVTQTGEVLGARRDQNNITLDGVDVNDNQSSGITALNGLANGSQGNGAVVSGNQTIAGFNAALPIPLDSVQEFRVTVAGQGANLGRSSGGQVTLVTKSGTNQLHASFYEYNRNTDLAANNWFNNLAGIKREALVRNQFGASLGGAVVKNRLFYFGNWERRIDASGKTQTRTVPTESLKQGILTFKTNNGGIQTLSPSEIVAVDPLHKGFSAAMKSYLSAYPTGNDPTLGADKGLNFTGLRFNSPFKEDDSAYVAKMDFNIDNARKHSLSVRGTLAGAAQDVSVAQFPGQAPAAKQLNNSKGISGNYTWLVKPSLINVVTMGFTRMGLEQSGTVGTALTFDNISSPANYNARGFIHQIPSTNIADDLTWTKGKHSITTGINFRFITNNRSDFNNSFASYGFSRNTLQGLGGDITLAVNTFLQQRSGDPSLKITDNTSVTRAFGDVLGLLNQYSAVYQFDRSGKSIPQGQAALRGFVTHEYEGYVQDSWRMRRDFTLTYGLRYSNSSVPYETHGIQVATTSDLDSYFAERVNAAATGTPGFLAPHAALTYALNGPVNGKQSWYKRDNNNFAPRLAFAFSPDSTDHWYSRILGKGSVFRGGVAMVYDRYGNDLVTAFDQTGSPGLATSVTQPQNTNFTSASRYNGTAASYPALPASSGGSFPYTPETITGGFGQGVGISNNLVAPYSFILNASYARELPGKLTLEVGYAGRLSRKNLVQQDYYQPLTNFKDPASGQTWKQASAILRNFYEAGITPDQVAKNPSLIPKIPFFENQFPGLADAYLKGSASANYFDNVYNQNGGSDLDALNQVDRDRGDPAFPNCVSKAGCNTFFPLQNAGLPTWTNAGFANYHAGILTVRRSLSNGLAFDFNYTLAHSIDNSSGAESGASTVGAVIQDAFNPSAFRGSSDFDIRHNITTDVLMQLPVGRSKKYLSAIPVWADQVIGGWQVSLIGRYRSGLPSTISNGGIYPTNYENSALAIPNPGTTTVVTNGFDQNQLPSLYANTSTVNNYIGQYPGDTGTRAIVRLAGQTNFDVAFAKAFALPWEGHRLQFRAEGFNAFNNVNFQNPSLSLAVPAKFGEYQSALPGRVVQLSLRYEF